MQTLTKLDENLVFPDSKQALKEPNGLLAFGGDLSAKRLRLAYSKGIFPWFSHQEPIMWWSPSPRGVTPIEQFKCSKSLAKFARKCDYTISINQCFNEVIDACATIQRNDSGTWITSDMIEAYKNLHQLGHAHSIEVWQQQTLVGGLYGVVVGRVFCGESMFHKTSNASKLAFMYLVKLLKQNGAQFIDCQMQNPHLASLGCIEIPRDEFLLWLQRDSQKSFNKDMWRQRTIEGITWP